MSQDSSVVIDHGSHQRIAAIDGVTPTLNSPLVNRKDSAIWATEVVRTRLLEDVSIGEVWALLNPGLAVSESGS